MPSTYLNIGSGPKHIPGFINVDLDPVADVQLDVTEGLPFAANSVDGIFSEHFIEHIGQAQGLLFFRECRRVLKPNGRVRIATPDLDALAREYASEDWLFHEWGEYGYNWIDNRGEMLNLALREWGHQWVYNEAELVRLGRVAGLTFIQRCALGESEEPMLRGREYRAGSRLIVEFTKDRAAVSPEPLVSILIPAYKPTYFQEALESALQQTYPHLEIIISDDSASPDIEMMARAHADPRLRYFRNAPPLGGQANHVRCIELAAGEYIKFLNDDDHLHPHCVERMRACLQQFPDVTLVTSHRQCIDANGVPLPDIPATRRPVTEDSWIAGASAVNVMLARQMNFLGEPTTTMFRKRDVQFIQPHPFSLGNRPCLASVGDQTLWASLLSQGDAIYLVDTLSFFRQHPAQEQRDPALAQLGPRAFEQLVFDARRMGFLDPRGPQHLLAQPLPIKPWWPASLQAAAQHALELLQAHDARAPMALQQALTMAPDEASLLVAYGKALQHIGDVANAEREFSRAATRHPAYAPAHWRLSGVLSALGQTERAVAALRRAHELAPPLGSWGGFYTEEGGVQWMSGEGLIRVNASLTPAAVRFKLASGNARYYPRFPLEVRIFFGSCLIQTATFTSGNQMLTVEVAVPETSADAYIRLESTETFIPSQLGLSADSRVLSVLLSQFSIQPHVKPLAPASSAPPSDSQLQNVANLITRRIAASSAVRLEEVEIAAARLQQRLASADVFAAFTAPTQPLSIVELELLRLNAEQARADGKTELAQALDRIADYAVQNPTRPVESVGRLKAPLASNPNGRAGEGPHISKPVDEDAVRAKIARYSNWYHQIEVAPGIVTPGINASKLALSHLDLPISLHGLRVLDIGAADGFYTFEAEKRGAAEVAAIDYRPPHENGFGIAAELLGSRARHFVDNIYDLSPAKYGQFDVVFFLGLLYHLPDPMLAIQIVRSLCKPTALVFIESQVSDQLVVAPNGQTFPLPAVLADIPLMQFYPGNSLNQDYTNYWGPNVAGLREMLRESGFAVQSIKRPSAARALAICTLREDWAERPHLRMAYGNLLRRQEALIPPPEQAPAEIPAVAPATSAPGARPAASAVQGAPEKRAIFTIVSKNYLSFARVFSHSVRRFHPEAEVFVLLVDRVEGAFDPATEPFTLVTVDELTNIPVPTHLFFKYDIMELNTAVKPYFIQRLFEQLGYTKVLYFDPDIEIFDRLDGLWQMLDDHSLLLTPHITEPYTDGKLPDEVAINQAGIYNLGFIGLANTPATRNFVQWWGARLYHYCASEVEKGLFTDQRWVNYAPAFLDQVGILRDPVYNIAYWNLHSRRAELRFDGQRLHLGTRPVVFFHYSGFDPADMDKVSKHQNRFRLSDLPHLQPLFQHYRDLLMANGYSTARQWKYAFDFFDNGIRIPRVARKLYRSTAGLALYFGDPFATQVFGNFFEWLKREMVAPDQAGTYPLSNLLGNLYLLETQLHRRFPDPLHKDRAAYLEWLRAEGAKLYKIDPAFLPPVSSLPTHAGKKQSNGKRASRSDLPFGVNVAGFLTGEFGVAEAARANVRAIQAASVPHVLNNLVYLQHSQRDTTFTEFSKRNPYSANLIHVNADTTQVFRNVAGQDYFNERYNIGVWWWELEHFPETWRSNFDFYQEIWAQSKFCQAGFAKLAPIPIIAMPHAVWLDESQIFTDRARWGLAPDDFAFLFTFDFFSVFERKNPLALVEAYRRAFGRNSRARLIIKSINSHIAPNKMAALQQAAEGLNVSLIDQHFDRQTMLSLLATCDAYVSLHRSEGFGQGIAEAMYLGKPVIATAYSGNLDFMLPGNSFLVNHKLVELERSYPPYEKGNVWAEPDVNHAAELMRQVFEQRELAETRGRQAAADMRAHHSYAAVGAKIAERLRLVAGGQTTSTAHSASLSPKPAPLTRLASSASADLVIPIYGQAALLQKCVASVLKTAPAAHLILVDDCSPGAEVQRALQQWQDHPQITLACTPQNSGFIGACQLGASLGQAPFILFLNSDTEATEPGWLEKLMPPAEDIAIVGAKLIYPPDVPGPLAGTIQHAGVARNANGVPYHPFLGQPADAPEVNMAREVNAVTGGCLLIRRAVWDELGGWDARFGKGVYEDVDLCWQARQKGYRILYQPAVCFHHHESASKAQDGRHALNEHTPDNLKKLLAKWPHVKSDEDLFFDEKTVRRWERARKQIARAETAIQQRNFKTALSAMQKALESAPDLADAQIGYAQLVAAQGQHAEAAQHFEAALKYAPTAWTVRLKLVDEWQAAQQPAQAAAALKPLLAVFPTAPEIQQRAAQLVAHLAGPAPQFDDTAQQRAAETFQRLLNAENLATALEQNRDRLDADLIALIHANAQAAQADGDAELVEGLAALAERIYDMTANIPGPAEILQQILDAEDVLAALEERRALINAPVLELVRANAQAARADRDDDLADGLDTLAEHIEHILRQPA